MRFNLERFLVIQENQFLYFQSGTLTIERVKSKKPNLAWKTCLTHFLSPENGIKLADVQMDEALSDVNARCGILLFTVVVININRTLGSRWVIFELIRGSFINCRWKYYGKINVS